MLINVLSQRRLIYRSLSTFFEVGGNCRLLVNVYTKTNKALRTYLSSLLDLRKSIQLRSCGGVLWAATLTHILLNIDEELHFALAQHANE